MSQLRALLTDLGLGDYAERFEAEEIDLGSLRHLTDDMLRELGLPMGPRAKLRAAISDLHTHELEPNTPPEVATPQLRDAERRQLTVMFCDLAESPATSETFDPEDLRGLMADFQRICGGVTQRYGGHVAQYLGDGLMIYFGWPSAHEDDVERAIRAALDIVVAVKEVDAPDPLRVRVGIATGQVVVGKTGAGDASIPATAVGETPNLAARMQSLADPDQIIVAPTTQRQAGAVFTWADLGHKTLKGMNDTVHCWRAEGVSRAAAHSNIPVANGLTPYVGRKKELAGLTELIDQVERGDGQMVVLYGDPGVGKSRLLHEFRDRVGDRVAWVEGRAISFGQSMAFHPLVDMLRQNFGIDQDDGSDAIRDKVTAGLARVSESLASSAPTIHHLLGAASEDDPVRKADPQIRRAEIFDTLRRLLIQAAERKPQVIVFEDLHWSDVGTRDFLRYILDGLPASRALIVTTLRTGHGLPFGEHSFVTRIALQNLGEEDSTRIAEAVLTTADLPSEVRALIHRKAEGNPFFVEELVKSLDETGAIRRVGESWALGRPLDQIAVPDTVQGVLMSRIDRLEEQARHTLQLASVIGREFTQRLLDHIDDLQTSTSNSLRELQAIELIRQKALYPELAFMFKHALAQDVAYGSLLVRRRRDLHRKVAKAIEDLFEDRVDEHFAMIAHHFAAAEDWPKAADYFEKAADHAAAAFAVPDAIALGEEALKAFERSGESNRMSRVGALHGRIANLYALISDFKHAHTQHSKAAKIARDAGGKTEEGRSIAAMGLISFFAHDFDSAARESREAVDLGRATGSNDIVAAGICTEAWVEAVTGRLADVRSKFEQSKSLASSEADFYASFAASGLTITANWQGEYQAAIRKGEEAVTLARRRNLGFPLLFALFSLGLSLSAKGEHDRALTTVGEGLSFAEKLGDEIFRNRFLNCIGTVHADCGDLEHAITLNSQARDFSTMRGDPETIANAVLNLGDAALAQGDRALARELFDEIHKLAGNPSTSDWMKWRYSQHLFAGYGETCLALDDPSKAHDWAD